MILADTNVWSVLSKPQRETKPLSWLLAHEPDLWLSPIVIAEIRYGLERPEAVHKRSTLEQWLRELETEYRPRTLAFDSAAGHALGRLLLARPQDAKMPDLLMAAQALSRDCPIATRNTRDFEWTGVALINPWSD